jgi:hypothetical protein
MKKNWDKLSIKKITLRDLDLKLIVAGTGQDPTRPVGSCPSKDVCTAEPKTTGY